MQAAGQQPVMHSREPDITVFPAYSLAGENPVDPRIVVEIEVDAFVLFGFVSLILHEQTENRTPLEMRAHYADYFTNPDVMAVLGVIFWETTRRAAAILWTRQTAGGPITVAEAVDFGIAPLTDHPVIAHFDDPTLAGLPAVPQGMWVRFVVDFALSHVIFEFPQMELHCASASG